MDASTPPAADLHRALASPVRARLLELLRAADEGLDARALAGAIDLHPNTVRSHLAVLTQVGLVVAEPEPRSRPGRPRLLYRAAADGPGTPAGAGGHRFLADVLAGYVAATAEDPARAAQDAGSVWGRHLVERPAPFTGLGPPEIVQRLVDLMADAGFDPAVEHDAAGSTTLVLRRCPFGDLATAHPEVVCGVHLGLLRGALDELGAGVRARDLRPFVSPGRCESHLEVSP